MLLITGPSGNVGADLIRHLDKVGTPYRLASRDAKLGNNRAHQAVRLDFFDRRTWSAALEGVDRLFLLFPLPGNRAARQAIVPFVAAAAAAGCRHVVYVSVFGADRIRFLPHHTVEKALFASDMTSTVLRCSYFMQNLHRAISSHGVDIADHREVFIPAGNGRTTFLDAADAAAVAAQALTDPDTHGDRVYHLTGPAALSMSDVAVGLSRALGYPVRYTRPGMFAFVRRMRARGLSWDTIGFMSAVYTATRMGLNQPVTDDVTRILGRPPRDLDTFLTHAAWRWKQQSWT